MKSKIEITSVDGLQTGDILTIGGTQRKLARFDCRTAWFTEDGSMPLDNAAPREIYTPEELMDFVKAGFLSRMAIAVPIVLAKEAK